MKYKLNYKALDASKSEHRFKKVAEFFKAKYPDADFNFFKGATEESSELAIFYRDEEKRTRQVRIEYQNGIAVARKMRESKRDRSFQYMPFTLDELKFLDMLDIELHEIFKRDTRQNISNWYEIEQMPIVLNKIVEFYKEQGFEKAEIKETDRNYPLFQTISLNAPVPLPLYIQLDFEVRRIAKRNSKHYVKFEPVEIEFFKRLNFTTDTIFSVFIHQQF